MLLLFDIERSEEYVIRMFKTKFKGAESPHSKIKEKKKNATHSVQFLTKNRYKSDIYMLVLFLFFSEIFVRDTMMLIMHADLPLLSNVVMQVVCVCVCVYMSMNEGQVRHQATALSCNIYSLLPHTTESNTGGHARATG